LALTTAFALASANNCAYAQTDDGVRTDVIPGVLPPLDRLPDPEISDVATTAAIAGSAAEISGKIDVYDASDTTLKLCVLDGETLLYTHTQATSGGSFSFAIPSAALKALGGHRLQWLLTATDDNSLVLESGEFTVKYATQISAKLKSGKAAIKLAAEKGKPKGKVTVSVGKWKKTLTVDGKRSVALPKLAKGKHKVTVSFAGTDKYGEAKKTITLRVK